MDDKVKEEGKTKAAAPAKVEVKEEQKLPTPGVNPVEVKVKRAMDAWTDQHLRRSTFSRHTEAWNHFQAGLPLLIDLITKEMEG